MCMIKFDVNYCDHSDRYTFEESYKFRCEIQNCNEDI